MQSKTGLLQTLRAAYLAKERFSAEEGETLADMLAEIRKSNVIQNKAAMAQSNKVDARIKGSLMDGSERAVDGRAEKIQLEGSQAKWASK